MNIENALQKVTDELKSQTDIAHLEAEVLVMHCCNLSREQLFAHPEKKLTTEQVQKLNEYSKRRCAGEPIAYITGYKEFWSLDLAVTPDVLIPRPETEHLVEWALNNFPKTETLRVADLGAGSGAIAIALAKERPHWQVVATEKYPNALSVAQRNADHYQLNINFCLGHWCEALPRNDYHIIISNPPYICEEDPHLKKLPFEPKTALAAGKDGMDAINIIATQAKDYLTKGGFLILEHGYDQKVKVTQLLQKLGYKNIKDHNDLAGQPRFVTAQI